jgi:hypothetical protein
MIAGSLVLVLAAVAMLAYGLLHGSNPYLIGSVSASLLAAVALIVGGRQARSQPGEPQVEAPAVETPAVKAQAVEAPAPQVAQERVEEMAREPVEEMVVAGGRGVSVVADRDSNDHDSNDHGGYDHGGYDHGGYNHGGYNYGDDDYGDDDPPDEPPPQPLSAADAARVARMDDEVYVIDGRPRYHQQECLHLLGRDVQPLPVSEAVDYGFTPCGRCEPASRLLAQARQV